MTRHSRSIFDERKTRADRSVDRLVKNSINTLRVRSSGAARSTAPRSASSGPIGGGARLNGSREVVVKVLSKAKHAAGVYEMTRYDARVQGDEFRTDRDRETTVVTETSDGRQLHTRREIEEHVKSWDLRSAEENRSAAWRRASADERTAMDQKWAQASPEWRRANARQDPYYRNQAVHMMVSVKGADGDTMREIATDVAREHFSHHRWMVIVHDERDPKKHGHVHAHLIVKADDEDGIAARLRKADLAAMRTSTADAARARGIDAHATRRVDRLAEEISRGIEPEKKNDRSRGRWTPGDTMRKKAPQWWEAYGPEATARKAGAIEDVPAKRGYFERFVKPIEEKSEAFRTTRDSFSGYRDPTRATKSYLAMYAENPRLAQWTVNHSPKSFGTIDAGEPTRAPDGKTAAKAVRDLSGRLYPANTPNADELSNAAGAARSARARARGSAHVARSLEALAAGADRLGDPRAAEDIRARASAVKQGQPLPPMRPPYDARHVSPATSSSRPADEKRMEKPRTPEQLVAEYIRSGLTIAEMERQNDLARSSERAREIVEAKKAQRELARSIVKSPDALVLAKAQGVEIIQHAACGRGMGGRGL